MINSYIIEILMSVVIGVVGYLVGRIYKKIEAAESAMKEQNKAEVQRQIVEALTPIKEDFAATTQKLIDMDEKIQQQMQAIDQKAEEKNQRLKELFMNDDRFQSIASVIQAEEDLNKDFYKLQLINSCKKYNKQGYMTQGQFDTLTTIHKIYKDFGGNSQGDDYYKMALNLPIMEAEEGKKRFGEKDLDNEFYVKEADMGPHVKTIKDWDEND